MMTFDEEHIDEHHYCRAEISEQRATIETLRRRVTELEGERDRWKSAHHEMVDRNKLLRDRPDLPIERLQAYKQITAENAELKRQVEALREDAEVGRLVKSVLPISHGDALRIRKVGTTTYVDHIDIDGPTGNVDGHGLSLLEALRKAAKGEVEL